MLPRTSGTILCFLPGARAGSGWRDAKALVRLPGVGVFLLTSFGVSLTTPYAFQVVPSYLEARGVSRAWISTTMTLSQLPEIAVLALIPWVLGRIGYILSPVGVGIAAERVGWGPAVSATAIFPLVALALILWLLPETRGKELEETARV